MTTIELRDYLQVLQDMNAMSFAYKDSTVEFSVTLSPMMPVDVGTSPEPGGWKSPQNLDDPDKLFNYDKEPSV